MQKLFIRGTNATSGTIISNTIKNNEITFKNNN